VKTIQLAGCPSCGAAESTTVHVGTHPLRRCDRCHLVFAFEYADPDEIYVEGYLTGASDFGPGNLLDPTYQRFLLYAGHLRMERAERVVGAPGTMLDVGCGTGDVVAAAAERGWTATGVEPVEQSAEAAVARGLDVHCAMLQDSGLPEGSFDLVTAYHVVEHMSDSSGFLKLISRWARPGGHVLVEVPNYRSVVRRSGGEAWIGLRPLEHIGHYTPRTLRSTMERAGLEKVRVATMGFLWDEQTYHEVLADLGLYRHSARLGRLSQAGQRGDETIRVPRPAGWKVFHGLQRAYDAARVGPVVYAIGRVPGGDRHHG
jgi:2-polyprenyl-3-methyl-5-hydroxy-6-metoxy-1,4-benzoquinol methylase